MPVIAHLHDFTQTNGGFQCQTCSAFVVQSRLAADVSDASVTSLDPAGGPDINTLVNLAFQIG